MVLRSSRTPIDDANFAVEPILSGVSDSQSGTILNGAPPSKGARARRGGPAVVAVAVFAAAGGPQGGPRMVRTRGCGGFLEGGPQGGPRGPLRSEQWYGARG